jgi:uncharacterized membrane protein YheB (UPF0754 family)
MAVTTVAAGPFIDWEELTGHSKLAIDLITIPIFSAIAGLITNWTGVVMLFAPVRFTGFHVPGLKSLFPFLPRKVQILPLFAPDGVLGFQGFIPCRAEKMASLIVDMSISRIGSIRDFYETLNPDKLAQSLADRARPDIRRLTTEVIESEHRRLWESLPNRVKEAVHRTVDAELPQISRRTFAKIGEHLDELLNVKLMTIKHLRKNPEVLRNIIQGMAVPELRFMVRSGALGFFFGFPLALYLTWLHNSHPPVLSAIPGWLAVLVGAAAIGVIVNIIAIKVVFEPGAPQPRYKYLWKQGRFARRQHEAAGQLAAMLSVQVLTVANFAEELLHGASGDKTAAFIEEALSEEVNRILGPVAVTVGQTLGVADMDALHRRAGVALVDFAPTVFADPEFNKEEAKKIEDFATEKFRALPAEEFGEMLYSAIEQDAWLLYVHGGLLGIIVGALHILIFGA